MASLPVVKRVKLGSQGLEVSQQGLGCMGMSAFYGPPKPEKDMIELIHHAVDLGITFLDTADAYGPHTNEILVGKAIKGIREKVQLATKFGIYTNEKGERRARGDPEYVRSCVEGSLKRLDVDYIDLYYQHRVDVTVPIEVTVSFEETKDPIHLQRAQPFAGRRTEEICGSRKIEGASSADIRRAHAVHPITAVQLEWSLWSRDVEDDVIGTCRELGIGIVPYSPLGRGFFSGVKVSELTEGDFRKIVPRLKAENLDNNQKFYDRLVEIGKIKKKTPGQLALAWVQHQGEDVVPIPGTTKVKNLEENVGALGVKLSKEEIEEIEAAVPHEEVSGDRYADMSTTWRFLTTPPLSSWSG